MEKRPCQRCITIFVHNIPPKFHCGIFSKSLMHSSQRKEIEKRLSDAKNAIWKLNASWVYGYRIWSKFARSSGRSSKKDKFGAHVNKSKGVFYIDVKKHPGRQFLFVFYYDEAMQKMEAQGRTWLNGWFVEIKPWSSLTLKKHRITRLAVYGLPLHVWNYNTFRRIAAILGLGEETLKLDGFSHGTMSLMTDHLSRIEATITVQCGVENFQVRISEIIELVNNSLFLLNT
ncbi:hypothetical protein ERO13_D11G182850v2 [Gossypium hirsutum]|nr:hypothetical protein ERO13_D11G182850v2 [Gossypium hirsutum]